MTVRVLVVDDDPALAEMLGIVLRGEGFEPSFVADGAHAVSTFRELRPEIVLLDLMLPRVSGIDICRALRAESGVPIIMLTAKSDTVDVVRGLESGADDYVSKPFGAGELLARLRVALRHAAGASEPEHGAFRFGDLDVDLLRRRVSVRGEDVRLTPTEYKLLRYFLQNPQRVLSKAKILDHVWHYDFAGDANVVESYVSYLRRKIDTTEPRMLHTIRSVGYVLRMPRD